MHFNLKAPGTYLMGFMCWHHHPECCYDRLYWWLNFWDHHPRLFAFYNKLCACWAWCRNPFAAQEPEDKSDVPF